MQSPTNRHFLALSFAFLFAAIISSASEPEATRTKSGEILGTFVTGGQIWSSPVHHQGTIYLGSDDGCAWAIDLETLKPKWKADTGGRVRSTPAVHADAVYFASDDGFLYKVAASDGRRVWRFDLQSNGIERVLPSPYPPYSYDYLTSSPTLHQGVVFAGSTNGVLYAVDASTGEEKWRFTSGGRIRSTPKVHGGRVYFGSWDHHLYALDLEDGKQVWRFDTGGIIQATPAIGGGRVYIGSRNPKVFAVDEKTGKPLWEFEHSDGSWVESSAVYHDGTLFVGSSDALELFAFDAATGKVRWKYRTGGWSWSTPSISDGTIYTGAISAYPYYFEGVTLERGLHAVDATTGKGRRVVETRALPGFITGGVMSTPLVVDGKIVIGALDNSLVVIAE